ncbi:GntR family transcriptional regulator [Streptomyces sp. NPDC002265]|uniref:GntR family transcriptional regulator n=1 Tax=Streptomyces sp. NPDC002265 TaxID=3154415 RepID=UPI00331CD280
MSVSDGEDSNPRTLSRVYDALESRIADGTYPVGGTLPSQRVLAPNLNCSRDTVRKAARMLADAGLVDLKQGSGTVVLRKPSSDSSPQDRPRLHSFMSRLFAAPEASLDVFVLTGESVVGLFRTQVQRVEDGEFTELRKVTVRFLLPAEDTALYYPRAWDPADDRPLRRWQEMARRNVADMEQCRSRLARCGVELDLEVRRIPLTPQFKLCVFNGTHVLKGYYRLEQGIELEDGTAVEGAVDVMGVGATLRHFTADAGPDSEFFDLRGVFDDLWAMVDKEREALGKS